MMIDKKNILVNDQDDFDQISLDSEEETLNYTIVPNALLRDSSISPQCRWLIAFLLSNKQGWTIKSKQLVNHVKGFMGRDRVFKMLNEAIEAGYIERTVIVRKNLRGYSYRVASTPKFKKSYRCPEIQDTESQYPECQDPENTHTKELTSKELTYKKNTSLKVSPDPESPAAGRASPQSAKASEKKVKPSLDSFSLEAQETTQKIIETIKSAEPQTLISPSFTMKWLDTIDLMLRLDKRDAKEIIKIFRWVLHFEPFWGPKMLTNGKPILKFREQFDTFRKQMNAKPLNNNKIDRRTKNMDGTPVETPWLDNLF